MPEEKLDIQQIREKHHARLERWTGQPQKNHVRVLLCTLPDVLWQGHGIERVGMD